MRIASRTRTNRNKQPSVDIAVLDDDSDFIQYIEDFLNDEGLYTVRTFTHPDKLFLSCRERAPEIIFLDMKMGPFQGQEVLERLQQSHPGVCVIIVTGYPSLEDMRATFKRQVFDYLAKPFSLGQLRQTLKNAIAARGLGRTPQDLVRDRLGAPTETVEDGAQLVIEGHNSPDGHQHLPAQLDRTRRTYAEHRESAGTVCGLRHEALGVAGRDRFLACIFLVSRRRKVSERVAKCRDQ